MRLGKNKKKKKERKSYECVRHRLFRDDDHRNCYTCRYVVLSDRIPKSELDSKDFKRAVALPFLTDGEIPEEKNKTVDEDIHGLREVIILLFRSWPFVRPYFLGRWYTRSKGTSQEVADPLSGEGYGLIYAPVLATAITILGPSFGLIDIEFGTAESILYLFVASMVLSMWLLALGKLSGVRQSAVAIS